MRTDYLNPKLYNSLYTYMTYENVLALRVSLETGLRIDDVLSLRFDQLCKHTLTGVAHKTGKSYKKALSADLSKRLARLTPNKGGYLFPHRRDPMKHRTRQAVWANMKQAAKKMGITVNAAPHSARKTYAAELFADKGLGAVQKELQHDRLSTSMIYAFSNMLGHGRHDTQDVDIDGLAELIADKVADKVAKKFAKMVCKCAEND